MTIKTDEAIRQEFITRYIRRTTGKYCLGIFEHEVLPAAFDVLGKRRRELKKQLNAVIEEAARHSREELPDYLRDLRFSMPDGDALRHESAYERPVPEPSRRVSTDSVMREAARLNRAMTVYNHQMWQDPHYVRTESGFPGRRTNGF